MALQGVSCPPALDYKNITPSAAWPLTEINDAMYRRMEANNLSPWSKVSGFNFNTIAFDWMHGIYLGTARDLVASGALQ